MPEGTIEKGNKDPLLAALANIPVLSLQQLPLELQKLRLADAQIRPAEGRIRILHYRNSLDLYMVVNENDQPWTGIVSIPGKHSCSLYDAWENVISDCDAVANDGVTELKLDIDPGKSILILLDESLPDHIITKKIRNVTPICEIDWGKDWKRSICKSVHYPFFKEDKMINLPDNLEEENPKFSGFIRYEKKLVIYRKEEKNIVLEITDAHEGVEVFVNGRSLGIQIVPVYQYDLSKHLGIGPNQICIEVATTLERESVDYPNQYQSFGLQAPKVNALSGINGTVILKRCLPA